MPNGLAHHGRITRTVGNEETIIVFASKGWEVIVPGADHNFHTSSKKAAQLIVF